jgi:hypothetical protein
MRICIEQKIKINEIFGARIAFSIFLIILLTFLIDGYSYGIECPKVSNSTTPDEIANYLNSSGQSADPQCMTKMIRELSYVGEHATPFQVQTLIRLLDFQRPETDLEKMHIWSSSNGNQFPSVDALFRIG